VKGGHILYWLSVVYGHNTVLAASNSLCKERTLLFQCNAFMDGLNEKQVH
jgi:hypothetical protein